MKVPRHVVEARQQRLQELVASRRYLPVADLCRILNVSEATVRRDLVSLAQQGRLTRTHGGALAEFNDRFPSFNERTALHSDAKAALGRAARQAIPAGSACWFDSGTTLAALAAAVAANPVPDLRVLTGNLPAAETLSHIPGTEVFLTGGQMLPRQSALFGDDTCRSVEHWRFDLAFLSSEGLDAAGLWNSQAAIVELQQRVIRRASRVVVLVDHSKVGRSADHFLSAINDSLVILSNASPALIAKTHPEAAALHWHPSQPPPATLLAPAAPTELPVHFL